MSIEMEQAGILIVNVKGEELRGLYMARASARQATIDKHEKEIGRLRKVVEGKQADVVVHGRELVEPLAHHAHHLGHGGTPIGIYLHQIEAHRAAIARATGEADFFRFMANHLDGARSYRLAMHELRGLFGVLEYAGGSHILGAELDPLGALPPIG